MINTFSNALEKVTSYAETIGLSVSTDRTDLDPFFKGDLDGKNIWLAADLDDEEKLFNLLHLIGHSIQWNTDQALFFLGSTVHSKPTERTILSLYQYEWEANCYALFILQYLGFKSLRTWLYDNWKEDVNYLMQYYKTGKKEKILPQNRVPAVEIIPKACPLGVVFTAKKTSRDGIVINFNI